MLRSISAFVALLGIASPALADELTITAYSRTLPSGATVTFAFKVANLTDGPISLSSARANKRDDCTIYPVAGTLREGEFRVMKAMDFRPLEPDPRLLPGEQVVLDFDDLPCASTSVVLFSVELFFTNASGQNIAQTWLSQR